MRFACGIRDLAARKMAGREGGESRPWRRSQRREEKGTCRKENQGLGWEKEREPDGEEV